ncbi:MAG: hypothetical protein QF570_06755 [Myxococcota bacterium]|jgi:hypothetical protein|nr:hypothetical protein [Myxococcota bacterium]
MATPKRHSPGARRHAIVVAGMHRSGTSVLAGVLHRLGAALPATLLPANENNPRGYHESRLICEFHDAVLAEAGSGWSRVEGPDPTWFSSKQAAAREDELAALVSSEFGEQEVMLIKDPRVCRVLPLWSRVLTGLEIRAHYLIPVRDPRAVAASLERASQIPEHIGRLLWLDHILAAERETRGQTRAFVSQEALERDWRGTLMRAIEQAEIPLPTATRERSADIDAYLAWNGASTAASDPLHPWLDDTLSTMRRACEDTEVDTIALDRMRDAFHEAEAAFGPALAAAQVALETDRAKLNDRDHRVTDLESELEALRARRREQQAQLERRHEEAEALRKTIELLTKLTIDHTREPDRPASAELRASLEAIQKAAPADIPGLASTAALFADLHQRIAGHERERQWRADEIARLARDTADAKTQLTQARRERDAAETQRAALRDRVAELSLHVENQQRDTRLLQAQSATTERECLRLEAELARLLEERSKSPGALADLLRRIRGSSG